MYARVVRFTDVDPERIARIKAEISEADGPPEGVDSTGMKMFHDAAQGTAVFVGFFETEEKLQAAEEVLAAMDPSETPGTRASVDRCEIVIEADG